MRPSAIERYLNARTRLMRALGLLDTPTRIPDSRLNSAANLVHALADLLEDSKRPHDIRDEDADEGHQGCH